MSFTYKKLLTIFFLYSFILTIFLFILPSIDGNNILPYFFLIILTLILISYFFFQHKIDLFDPMTLFTIYYFSIIPTGYWLILNRFECGEYITNYRKDSYLLFNISISFFIIGYISAICGYYFAKRREKITIIYEPIYQIKNGVLFWFALINFLAGVINFLTNVILISGGDIGAYMSSMSIRHAIDKEISHTTIFYINTYISVFIYMFYLRRRKLNQGLIIIPLSCAIILLFSTGRVHTTFSYLLSVLAVYYYLNDNYQKNTKKYIKWLFLILFSAIFIYLYRVASNLSLNSMDFFSYFNISDKSDLGTFLQKIIFEKGNIPNIAVLMKIIDSWGDEIGFLYGKSLISWMLNILPSTVRPEGYQPSVMIKDIGWFPSALGAHPPTGIGEMYANFGIIGPIIGMFCFGVFCAWVRNFVCRYKNFWILVAYCQITTGFIFFYAKGEFDNLSLWQIIPIIVIYLILKFSTQILRGFKHIPEKVFN